MHRYKFLDFYGALSAKLSNISYPVANERFNPIQNRGLTNSIFGVYGGINIKLYKGLSGSLEYGVRYYETLGFGRHNNLVLQIAIWIKIIKSIEVILFRIDQLEMKRSELTKLLGSRGRVSDILKSKRKLSIGMIRKLNEE